MLESSNTLAPSAAFLTVAPSLHSYRGELIETYCACGTAGLPGPACLNWSKVRFRIG